MLNVVCTQGNRTLNEIFNKDIKVIVLGAGKAIVRWEFLFPAECLLFHCFWKAIRDFKMCLPLLFFVPTLFEAIITLLVIIF